MTKTLGQVAYEAYWALVAAEREMEDSADWNALPAGWPGQKAWQAAAEAVLDHAGGVPCGYDCGAARAVIEAAKAVNKYWKSSAPEKLEALFRAVEALEEVER